MIFNYFKIKKIYFSDKRGDKINHKLLLCLFDDLT